MSLFIHDNAPLSECALIAVTRKKCRVLEIHSGGWLLRVRGGRTCVLSRGVHGPVQGQVSCSCPYMHTVVVSNKKDS